jgi:TPR repeat protein
VGKEHGERKRGSDGFTRRSLSIHRVERPDASKALKGFTDEAVAGHSTPLEKLGEIYAEGQIVSRDLLKAREWCTKAIKAGRTDLAETLKRLK